MHTLTGSEPIPARLINPLPDVDRAQEIMRLAFRESPRPPSAGTRNSQAKLTERKVYAIRRAADLGASLSALAEAFGISERACRHIARRTSWAHLPEEGTAR
ncbi:hypothetical protein [Streptomyces sp. FH025]|uniref:hypothetical protein n=1 Tax=Streptomyces sp. FH025 TaxID=2815937 RepID=UPI001A9DC3E0|nr:hypothetical protein [Streptomyces sp. FH025]MBO1415544.1 hypothetical protein [Streptomyces sp. FH025]